MSRETLKAEEKRLRALGETAVRGATQLEREVAASFLLHAALQHAQKSEAYWEALREELEREDQLKPLPKLSLVPYVEDEVEG